MARTKWEIMQARLNDAREAVENLENEMILLEQRDCEINCSGCGAYFEKEADFADHFVIPDEQYLNLGHCPWNPQVTITTER